MQISSNVWFGRYIVNQGWIEVHRSVRNNGTLFFFWGVSLWVDMHLCLLVVVDNLGIRIKWNYEIEILNSDFCFSSIGFPHGCFWDEPTSVLGVERTDCCFHDWVKKSSKFIFCSSLTPISSQKLQLQWFSQSNFEAANVDVLGFVCFLYSIPLFYPFLSLFVFSLHHFLLMFDCLLRLK